MKEIYLSSIQVNKARNIEDLKIDLSKSERVHLLLTGRNGSGKTALLQEMNTFLEQVVSGAHNSLHDFEKAISDLRNQHRQILSNSNLVEPGDQTADQETVLAKIEARIKKFETRVSAFGGVRLTFAGDRIFSKEVVDNHLIVAFFGAHREFSLVIPEGVKKVNIKRAYQPRPQISDQFLQYIVNMKADRSFARDDGENEVIERIDRWFDNFQ